MIRSVLSILSTGKLYSDRISPVASTLDRSEDSPVFFLVVRRQAEEQDKRTGRGKGQRTSRGAGHRASCHSCVTENVSSRRNSVHLDSMAPVDNGYLKQSLCRIKG